MYRLKPRVTYPRFALITGAVAVALASPNLLAARIADPPPEPVVLGTPGTEKSLELGMVCDVTDYGMFQDYDCGDTTIDTLVTGKADDAERAARRMMRAFSHTPVGAPTWQRGVLVQQIKGGWSALAFKEDETWVVITSGRKAEQYLGHAIGLMGEDVPDGQPGTHAPAGKETHQ